MIKELKLINFIKDNEGDYKKKLREEPYNLRIDENENLILFKYGYLNNFDSQIVREARGIILEKGSWEVVCYPFEKFFNFNDKYASDIDWSTAKVQEKIDGSLISVYNYKDKWRVATTGNIDARNATLPQGNEEYQNFYQIFMRAVEKNNLCFDDLDKNFTYLFELISPYNRVVVKYDNIDIYHIGTRNNKELKEVNQDIGIKKPELYDLNSIDEVVEEAKQISAINQEGFVIVDNNFNRVKVKNPGHIRMMNIISHEVTDKKILELILKGEDSEFVNYFPEYKDRVLEIEDKYLSFLDKIKENLDEADEIINSVGSRKEYAMWAKDTILPFILFDYFDGKLEKEEYREYVRKNLKLENMMKNIREV